MSYEIDFIGVSKDKAAKDADAIAFRWKTGEGAYKIGVFDGGLQAHGQALTKHLNQYYFNDPEDKQSMEQKIIDCLFVSHSDQDHTVGLQEILEKFTVKTIYMNCPWKHVSELYERVIDDRVTLDSLTARLHEEYPYISKLEKIALSKGITIKPAFQGTIVENILTVLSPSKEFYLELLAESPKTPKSAVGALTTGIHQFSNQAKTVLESWTNELLRNDVETSPENETSLVVLGQFECEKFLLMGDAGIRALTQAIDYTDSQGINLTKEVRFLQVPHHGGRHNVGPNLLNRLLGPILSPNTPFTKTAYVSAAEGSDHPRQMVVNAFTRRGVNVYITRGNIIWHHNGTPAREGWSSMSPVGFNKMVEGWEN